MMAGTHFETHPAGHELQAWRDGELTGAEAERVADHCARCPVCAATLRDLDRVSQLLGSAADPTLHRSFWPQLDAVRRGEPRLGPAFTATAAVACLVGLLIGIWFGPLRLSPEETSQEVATTETDSPFGVANAASLLDVYGLEQE